MNDYVRSVKADFVFLCKEMADGEKRLSFRSKNDAVDVRILAAEFGGGGHKMASGGRCRQSDSEILEVVERFGNALPKPLS